MAIGTSSAMAKPPPLVESPFEPDSGSLVVHCGQLINGLGDVARGDVYLIIRNGRFSQISTVEPDLPDLPELDLSDHTCLPGLIEMHTHLLEDFADLSDLSAYYDYSLEEYLESGRKFAKITLESGITSARSMAVYYAWADKALRDEIWRGETVGPRMQAAGYYLTIPGGGGDLLESGGDASQIPAHLRMGVSSNIEEFRVNAQAAVDGGADILKVVASGAVLAYGGIPGKPEMSLDELNAVIDIAHAAGLRVAAHAHGTQSIIEAILAGADTIEHATYIDEEGIRLAIENDVALSMEIGAGDWMIENGLLLGWPEEFVRKTIETTEIQRENFRRAHQAGVTMVFGTDASIYPHGDAAKQFAFMIKYGMTPMEAIESATGLAAKYMGWEDRVGSIQSGLLADIVAVKGDPLEDITLLESIDVVIQGGLVFKAPAPDKP